MRLFVLTAVMFLAGCSSAEWRTAGLNPGGYGAVAAVHLTALREGDTAADVIRKMGSPVGEIPLPWIDYDAADHAGKCYRFQFAHGKRKDIHPQDRLLSVELVSPGSAEMSVTVWPPSKQEANQAPEPTAPSGRG